MDVVTRKDLTSPPELGLRLGREGIPTGVHSRKKISQQNTAASKYRHPPRVISIIALKRICRPARTQSSWEKSRLSLAKECTELVSAVRLGAFINLE
jgi:hypothetical protein